MMTMKINICFKFLFNNTGFEWHELQKFACSHIIDETLHCMVCAFKGEPDVTVEVDDSAGGTVDLFFRLNDNKIEIVALKHD